MFQRTNLGFAGRINALAEAKPFRPLSDKRFILQMTLGQKRLYSAQRRSFDNDAL
jgi:hypothetical protein